MDFAPRLDPRLVRAIGKLDDPHDSIAEIRRKVGAVAGSLGVPRPSYERVRQIVHAYRAVPDPDRLGHLADLAFNSRRADRVIADLLLGEPPPHR